MRKKVILATLIAVIAGFSFVLNGFAQNAPMTAVLPVGNVVTTITEVDSNGTDDPLDDVFLGTVAALNFGSLAEAVDQATGTKLGVFLPANNHYFAVDVANSGGGLPAGPLTVAVGFQNPVSGESLGPKASSTFVKTSFVEFIGGDITKPRTLDDQTITGGGRALFSTILATPRNFDMKALAAGTSGTAARGWLRFYAGINNGVDADNFPPITALDPAGTYSGTITITVA